MAPPKSPAQPALRRSSRASTPTQRATSPRLHNSTSTPSLSSQLLQTATTGGSVRKSHSSRALSPSIGSGTRSNRPSLPTQHANVLLNDKVKTHKVKLQTLHLGPSDPATSTGDETITIARVKCPVPKGVPGHIIKRFDTNAVSASSLFRAAFPTASAEEEATEMAWIAKGSKGKYGNTKAAGVEHDEARKLSGTWIPAANAPALALEYGVLRFAEDLIKFSAEDAGISATPAATRSAASLQVADSEGDSPAPVRSPRSKRQRVQSPPTSNLSPTPRSPLALSGASATGVSIHQTLETDAAAGITTETTRVSVDIPLPAGGDEGNGLVASDEAVAEQIEQAKKLVKSLKEEGTLKRLSEETPIPSSTTSTSGGVKRALEQDDDEDGAIEHDTAATRPRRGFFGRMFGGGSTDKKEKELEKRRLQRERDERAVVGQQLMVIERHEEVEGRRWVAGLGLAIAVGATAAAPYLFG